VILSYMHVDSFSECSIMQTQINTIGLHALNTLYLGQVQNGTISVTEFTIATLLI